MQENLLKGWQDNIKMKKIKYLLPLIVMIFFLVTSCSKKTYIITFITDSGTIIENQEVKKGDKVVKPDNPLKDGYTFVDWYLSDTFDESTKYTFEEKVENDFTLYARYTKNEYKITYNLNYSTDNNVEVVNFSNVNEISLMVPTREGYEFLGWYQDGQLVTNLEERDYNLVAEWERTHYIIKYIIDDETTNTQLLEIGDSLPTLSTPSREGYRFLGWYIDEDKLTEGIIVNTDITITARWEIKTYNVRFISYTNDAIPLQKVEYGKLVAQPKTPIKEGYTFLGWINIIDYFDFNTPVTENLQLIAKWEMNEDTIESYIQSLIPNPLTENIPIFDNLSFCSATFVWSSSNEEVISKEGYVRRLVTDNYVDINVEVIYDTYSYNLKFETLVPKIELKKLVKGSIVSGYLYGSGGFTDLTKKALEQLDYINFSFAEIVNGEISLPDNKYVEQVLNYRNSGVRIGLAIGGWGSGGFSEAMATAAGRTKLTSSIMSVLKDYQFDGIDIDWEYPTSSVAGIVSSPSDRTNLTLFTEELREKMDAYRDDLVLSIAIAPNNSFYDLRTLNNYMDYFNVMTYDFSMGTKAGHDSSLYSTSVTSSSLDNSVSIVKNYVDSDKIIPGAAFYARYGSFASTSNAKLGGTLSVAMSNALSFSKMYERILTNKLTELYDVDAEAAYIISGTTYYSYDNERSIIAKCNYVKEKGLAGLMCWDLTQDYVDSNSTSILLNAMYENLK